MNQLDRDLQDARARQMVLDAAGAAGLSPAEWLRRTVEITQSCDDPIDLPEDEADEFLTPVSQVLERPDGDVPPCATLKDEVERLHQVMLAYSQVLAPAAAILEQLPGQVEQLSGLVDEARRATEAAHKAAASIMPLERALLKLLDEAQAGELDHRHDKRGAGIGKFLRGHA